MYKAVDSHEDGAGALRRSSIEGGDVEQAALLDADEASEAETPDENPA